MELRVQTIGGDWVKSVTAEPYETIYALKQELHNDYKTSAIHEKLVYAEAVLDDRLCLADYGLKSGATLQVVRTFPSGLSRCLHGMQHSAEPDDALAASLTDIADSAMRVKHLQSERCLPSPAAIERALSFHRRGELVSWMLRAFAVLRFDDRLLHNTILTLDRYCAIVAEPIHDPELQSILLAAVCIEMKMSSADDFAPGNWQRILLHLCQGTVSLPKILKAERSLLDGIGYIAGIPTVIDFLRSYCIQLEGDYGEENNQLWLELASLLLDMVLFDARLQYNYPHAVLALSALCLAMLKWNAPPQAAEAVFEDVVVHCPNLTPAVASSMLRSCAEEILTLWKACAGGDGPWACHFPYICDKRSCDIVDAARTPLDNLDNFVFKPDLASQRADTGTSSSTGARCGTRVAFSL